MSKLLPVIFLLSLVTRGLSQEIPDSNTLDEVIVRAFEQNTKKRNIATNMVVTEFKNADRNTKTSLVNGLNTVAGVRMEERSPGSYRINIRGSSLRSPFGVRNVKVYWNDIPITDPGGNTYFNQFAYNNFEYIEINKGPAGSLYGAGTGGLIMLNSLVSWNAGANVKSVASAEYVSGNYGLHNVLADLRFGSYQNRNQITYNHSHSDGYRTQTEMRRDNFSWHSRLKLSDKQQLNAAVLFNDIYYQTPGALTLAEYKANPKAARPAGGGFPSAVDAKAAIFQKTITAGLTSDYQIARNFKNATTLYGAFAQIKNSAIRNYERRNEPSFGGRSLFTFYHASQQNHTLERNIIKLIAGTEFQQGFFNTQVSKNRNGNPDTLQTNDDIDYTVYSIFFQSDVSFRNKLFFMPGISLNKTRVKLARLSSYPVVRQEKSYRNEFSPRIAMRKNFGNNNNFFLKASISRGFSPPSVAELLPSTGVISTDLEAEYGWNYELTVHRDFINHRLEFDVTGFYFKLNKALVQRRDLSGADFFVNAGDVKEKGIETEVNYFGRRIGEIISRHQLQLNYTFNHFRYGSFMKGTDNFSGKTVPSVPGSALSFLADFWFKHNFYWNTTWYSASKIYLNDANTAKADPYQLLGMRIGWVKKTRTDFKFNFYAGADNLLDERYSLGNDINAAANRFYNAAPRRNYYMGIMLQHTSTAKKPITPAAK